MSDAKRRALVVAHDHRSLPGMVGERLAEHGFEIVQVVPADGDRFPPPEAFDVVVAMGAPWCLRDEEIAGWVGDELDMIRKSVARDVPVLGICFGAQALASALGATVSKGARKELGWLPVETLAPERIAPGPWLQWHGDVFTLPEGATLLARTDVGPQAFEIGPHLGVQFHPEATVEVIGAWVDASRDELAKDGIDPDELLAETSRRQRETRPWVNRLVDDFLGRAGLLAGR